VKKTILVAFAILALCSLLLVNAGTVNAAEASGYTRYDYPVQTAATIDGEWNDIGEWSDTDYTTIGSDVAFGSTWGSATAGVYTTWLVEVFSDTTDDATDTLEMCLDFNNGGGTGLDGAGTYYRLVLEGDGSTFTLYEGSGSGWTEITPSADPADVAFATSVTASPNGTTPHRIWEIAILKNAGTGLLDMNWGVRVAAYDDDTTTTYVWPPDSEQTVPDDWATNGYSMDNWVPEGFSIAIVVLLSSAAVAVAFYSLRKRPKTAEISYKL
jgi:hypothetical protein